MRYVRVNLCAFSVLGASTSVAKEIKQLLEEGVFSLWKGVVPSLVLVSNPGAHILALADTLHILSCTYTNSPLSGILENNSPEFFF